MSSPKIIAKWMYSQLQEYDELYQEEVARDIQDRWEAFVREDAKGNLVIDKNVLKEFSALTDDSVSWDKNAKVWRVRD